jgi:hypothetical protein
VGGELLAGPGVPELLEMVAAGSVRSIDGVAEDKILRSLGLGGVTSA